MSSQHAVCQRWRYRSVHGEAEDRVPCQISSNMAPQMFFFFFIKPDNFEDSDFGSVCVSVDGDRGLWKRSWFELKTSSLWSSKSTELRKELEGTERDQRPPSSTVGESLPVKSDRLKMVARAMLSAFGSTYRCGQIYSPMKSILSPSCSRLVTDHSEACVQLSVQ